MLREPGMYVLTVDLSFNLCHTDVCNREIVAYLASQHVCTRTWLCV